MLKTINELFDKWWVILLYTAMWTAVFYIPICIVQKKKHNK